MRDYLRSQDRELTEQEFARLTGGGVSQFGSTDLWAIPVALTGSTAPYVLVGRFRMVALVVIACRHFAAVQPPLRTRFDCAVMRSGGSQLQ